MKRIHLAWPLVVALACLACTQDPAERGGEPGDNLAAAPLDIAFNPFSGSFFFAKTTQGEPSCGLPPGRQQLYDSRTGTFHIHLTARDLHSSGFEVTKVAARFTRPIVFRLTGDTYGAGCLGRDLTLTVDDKDYPLVDGPLSYGQVDRTLFHSQRDGATVTVTFTRKGEALLKPGAQVWLQVDTAW